MTTDDIRTKFLDFFASKGHCIVESDSVVPKDDPTVLFTTAGMQQFKQQFLGHVGDYRRAASSQKCLRTDDLDKIGKSDVHHTFFEMLGNFSFGDYFKKEAIAWAWEFLTQELKLPAEKLWVSVYKDDNEAYTIWLKDIKIPKGKIVKLGDHTNFWPADAKEKGPNGPCGPCSEIFFDYGPNPKCTNKKCGLGCDCGRFSEIWNLVFTQFNRKDNGVLEPLPNKNIDTGMGLERLAAVVQGKKSNYEIDVFATILEIIRKELPSAEEREKRIIADHVRAIVFGINDGVIPSNDGRGYIIKKLIIDTTDIVLRANGKEDVVGKFIAPVIKAMGKAYPEINNHEREITQTVTSIAFSYAKVYQERIPELKQQALAQKDDAERLGEILFKFQDTYGLTVDTIQSTVGDLITQGQLKGSVLDRAWEKRNKLFERQQEQSRATSKMTGDVFQASLDLGVPKTHFLGYDHHEATTTILRMFIGDKIVSEAKKGDHVKVILDKTPFYAESGGQIGDRGTIACEKGTMNVTDTQKISDVVIHLGEVDKGHLNVGEMVQANIDVERRMAIMRNHTATHLLQAALRDVLGPHIKQQGSLVAEDRLRFDFTHPKAVSKKELDAIERRVNETIVSAETVTKEYMDIDEARNSGALAFFAEKYGKTVRIVSIGNVSKEFCGGTHLDNIGQIGLLKIISEGAVAQGIRRLEAKTGLSALEHIKSQEQLLEEVANILKTPVTGVVSRIDLQTKRLKQLEKEVEEARFITIKSSIDEILRKANAVNGTQIISHDFANIDIALLRKVCEFLKQKTKSSVIVLGSQTDENTSLLVAVTDDLIKQGIKADDLIKEISPLINGSGGGRPQLAQAGSREKVKMEQTLKEAQRIIKGKLTK
ncbi:MAG: alanine--tRNA ligase [Candidatus Omnitrophota bacterium]|nr:alanine--tRNA ligase [Candidatus Omnitrophota bacterium]